MCTQDPIKCVAKYSFLFLIEFFDSFGKRHFAFDSQLVLRLFSCSSS